MTPRLTSDFEMVTGVRKTATINNELKGLQLDAVALPETWLAESGKLGERSYTFFRQGKSENECVSMVSALQSETNCLTQSKSAPEVSKESFIQSCT